MGTRKLFEVMFIHDKVDLHIMLWKFQWIFRSGGLVLLYRIGVFPLAELVDLPVRLHVKHYNLVTSLECPFFILWHIRHYSNLRLMKYFLTCSLKNVQSTESVIVMLKNMILIEILISTGFSTASSWVVWCPHVQNGLGRENVKNWGRDHWHQEEMQRKPWT